MKILTAIDFSEATAAVVEAAAELARAHGADVWLLHVAAPDPAFVGYEAGPQSQRDAVAVRLHEEHRELAALAEGLTREGIACTPLLIQGQTVERILAEADRLEAAMIVMGSHGKGAVRQMLFGSVSQGVLHRTRVPVLIVPTRAAEDS